MTRSLKKVWIPVAAGASADAVFYYMRRRARSSAAPDVPDARPSKLARRVEDCVIWRFANRFALIAPGKTLRLELTSPAIVRWTTDGWDTVHDSRTVPMDGAHIADIDTLGLEPGERVQFTFYWPDVNRWEGQDFDVRLAERARYGGVLSD
jgi:glucoamylase